MFPMCAPIFGSRRHSSSSISLICSAEITRIHTLEVIRKTVQDPCPGSGNRELNNVSKSSSDLQCHSATLPNERDGISVISFSAPGMCTGVIGHTPRCFILIANARTSCAAMRECREASRFTQPTVGSLSLNTATLRSRRSPQTASITSHVNSSPAISKSEFVMVPRGFWSEISSFLMYSGHS